MRYSRFTDKYSKNVDTKLQYLVSAFQTEQCQKPSMRKHTAKLLEHELTWKCARVFVFFFSFLIKHLTWHDTRSEVLLIASALFGQVCQWTEMEAMEGDASPAAAGSASPSAAETVINCQPRSIWVWWWGRWLRSNNETQPGKWYAGNIEARWDVNESSSILSHFTCTIWMGCL